MPWANWTQYWKAAIAACEAKPGAPTREAGGKSLPRFHVDPAAAPEEVVAVEEQLGFSLPPALRKVLTGFSKHVDVAWQLPEGLKPPAPLRSVIAGECSWDLSQLVEMDKRRIYMMDAAFPDSSMRRTWSL